MPKIEILDGDDWVVVKVDGEKVTSGHSISNYDLETIFKRIGCEIDVSYGEFVDGDEDEFVSL